MKQKILMTFVESGFGHITTMESLYDALTEKYSDKYDIVRSFVMHEDADLDRLAKMEKFLVKNVQLTNSISWYGDFTFFTIRVFGGDRLMRVFHKGFAKKSFRQGLEAIKRRDPDVIVTNHYFTQMLAVEYKRTVKPDAVVINYNPDSTLHSFWDPRDGIFILNNEKLVKRAKKLGFKDENLRVVTPCVRRCAERCDKTKAELRDLFGLPQDKFTVTVADGAYFVARGAKYAREIIKSGLPITLCVLAGKNEERYEEFTAIAEGRGDIEVKDGMTLKVFRFLDNAHELYGASDLFLTKGGSVAMLDSMYMHTPVMVNSAPNVIEKAAINDYVRTRHCGECLNSKKKAIKRIRTFIEDKTDLDRYNANIDALIAAGNGIDKVADIIDEEAQKRAALIEADAAPDTGDTDENEAL